MQICLSRSESWVSQWIGTQGDDFQRSYDIQQHKIWPWHDRKTKEIRKSKTEHLSQEIQEYKIQEDKCESKHCCETRPMPGKYCTYQIVKSSEFLESLEVWQYGTFGRVFSLKQKAVRQN